MSLIPFLHRVIGRENLSPSDAEQAMAVILSGQATSSQIGAFLVALRMKGETADELLGLARAMRKRSTAVPVEWDGQPMVDTCGTGGDGGLTFNVSTVAAFVVAGAGVRVAKHGNRSISSRCGSADLLEALGIQVDATPDRAALAIREVGFGFLFAPALHPAMRHAQPVRVELKMRTAFNLLGPLTNPAGAQAQVVGAPSEEAAALMAKALACLGLQRGFVVHGSDGMDEITTTGPTHVLEITRGAIADHEFTPEGFGVPRARLGDLAGGDAEQNAAIARAVLQGEKGPQRDIVLVNAAAALMAAGRARDIGSAMYLASQSIDSGAALAKLHALAAFCPR